VALNVRAAVRVCGRCGRSFAVEDGIARFAIDPLALDAPATIEPESLWALLDRGRRDAAARILDTTIPYNSIVLEVGCGNGELTNLLGIGCRRVIGTDESLAALRNGERFRARQELARVRFLEMRPQMPCLAAHSVDVLIFRPKSRHEAGALEALVSLVRPGGHVVVASSDPDVARWHRRFELCGLEAGQGFPALRGGVAATSGAEPSTAATNEPRGLFAPSPACSRLECMVAGLRRAVSRQAPGGVLGAQRFLLTARRHAGATVTAVVPPVDDAGVAATHAVGER
jgi:SAM-dependent methyltransferase